jgi:hypothetical protein
LKVQEHSNVMARKSRGKVKRCDVMLFLENLPDPRLCLMDLLS